MMQWDKNKAAEELHLPIETYENIVKGFFAQADDFVKRLNDKMSVEDYEGIAVIAHEIKGVAANFRIEAIRLEAENLERLAKEKTYTDDIQKIIQRIRDCFGFYDN